jgi:hypothetical protein
MAWNRHAIEQTQLRRRHRVDGVRRPKFDSTQVAYAGSPAPYIFGVHKANVGAALEHLGAGATGVIVVDVDVGVAHTTSRGDERAFALAENAGEPAATELSLGALGLGLARAVADARARV